VQTNELFLEARRSEDFYDLNRTSNGILLGYSYENAQAGEVAVDLPTHSGSHGVYDQQVRNAISEIFDDAGLDPGNLGRDVLFDGALEALLSQAEDVAREIVQNWGPQRLN